MTEGTNYLLVVEVVGVTMITILSLRP